MIDYTIPKQFEKIWDIALPSQDSRNDSGHALTVTYYASLIASKENCFMEIVIPAAILHDIGWSKLSFSQRTLIYTNALSSEKYEVRLKHQTEVVVILL